MSENPWNELEPPSDANTITARRVDASLPWDFFWAKDLDGASLLVLRHNVGSKYRGKVPKLKGVEISIREFADSDAVLLVFRLLDAAQRDLFHRLSADIVRAAATAASEAEAVRLALARTWRWHHLLGRGSDERLTEEEQKGLIGELPVLDRLLLGRVPPADAVMAWRGPLGAPKDFEFGRMCIEAKARRGGSAQYVTINSEHQLDRSGIDLLFLYVLEVARAPSGLESGTSITAWAERVRVRIEQNDPSAVDAYVSILEAAGLRTEDDYSDTLWVEGPFRLYQVSEEFPCIVASQVRPGITRVRYSLSLLECEPFLISETDFNTALEESLSVH
jgi:hypothetical protein